MLEALEYYQSLAQKFQGQLLTGPGILIVLTGLCIWLSGLRWKRLLGGLAGAAIAATGVFAVGQYPAFIVLAACIVGLLTGVLVNEIVLGLFIAAVGALIVMIILAGTPAASAGAPAVEFYDASESYTPDEITADDFVSGTSYPTWPQYEEEDVVIGAPAAIEITNEMAAYFVSRSKEAIAKAGTGSYAGAGFAVIIIMVLAVAAGRLFVSVTAAMFGAGLIFAGMIIALFYKGSEPISCIAQRPGFYWLIFTVMIAFGAFVQLILSTAKPETKKIEIKKKESEE